MCSISYFAFIICYVMWPRCAFLFSDCDEVPCEGLDNHAHFRNFGFAMLTLFRVSTGDNWNGILKVLRSIFLLCIFSFFFFSHKLVSAVHSKGSNCLQMEMSWMIPYLNDQIIKTELICIKICHIFVFFFLQTSKCRTFWRLKLSTEGNAMDDIIFDWSDN